MESQPKRDKYKESQYKRKMYKEGRSGIHDTKMVRMSWHTRDIKSTGSVGNVSPIIQGRMKESLNSNLPERRTRRIGRRAIIDSSPLPRVGSL